MTPQMEEAFIKLVDVCDTGNIYDADSAIELAIDAVSDIVCGKDLTCPVGALSVALDKHLAAEREKLRALLGQIECINNTLQQNTPRPGAMWENHEKLDDLLHEVYVLLGE